MTRRFAARVAALALLGLVLLAAATPQCRAALRTALFLPQVLPAIPLKPQRWVTQAPKRQEVEYPTASGNGVADLYLPGGGSRHSAVLLFLGVNPAGRDDPRVVGLAEGLARSGAVVMIPWSESMTQRRISAEDIDNLVKGFEFLRALDVVDADRVGMGGFCVGASFAMVAAQDPRISGHVRFVNFFGGYYDAVDLVKSVATRSRFYNGKIESWEPDRLSVEVVSTHLIEGLPDPQERLLLAQAFLGKAQDLQLHPDSLSAQARAVYALLSGPQLSEVDALIAQLPPETLESLRRISPSTRIGDLKARALIMHDREDNLVPSEESRRLADALGEGRRTYYTEFSLFQHVDPTQPISPPVYARESFKFFLHMYNVMREL